MEENLYLMVKLHNRPLEVYGTEKEVETVEEFETAVNHFKFLRENNLI